MTQLALDKGLLVNWTKSFNCPGVVGEDVVRMLRDGLAGAGVDNVRVMAILNDTTGTLVAGSHDYPACAIGLILGTGTNASYIEDAGRVVRWGDKEPHQGTVILDPEMGAFGDNGCIDFIKTEWDRQLDQESLLPGRIITMSVLMRIKLLPGSFTYEKYFSGKYLGDLTRIILASCLTEIGETLADDFVITTSDVSDVIRYCRPNPRDPVIPTTGPRRQVC